MEINEVRYEMLLMREAKLLALQQVYCEFLEATTDKELTQAGEKLKQEFKDSFKEA